MQRIFIFAESRGRKEYRGYFDGETFHPKLGFCRSLEELSTYDVIEIYGMDGLLCHSPKRFCSNPLMLMQREFEKEYGNQISMKI